MTCRVEPARTWTPTSRTSRVRDRGPRGRRHPPLRRRRDGREQRAPEVLEGWTDAYKGVDDRSGRGGQRPALDHLRLPPRDGTARRRRAARRAAPLVQALPELPASPVAPGARPEASDRLPQGSGRRVEGPARRPARHQAQGRRDRRQSSRVRPPSERGSPRSGRSAGCARRPTPAPSTRRRETSSKRRSGSSGASGCSTRSIASAPAKRRTTSSTRRSSGR